MENRIVGRVRLATQKDVPIIVKMVRAMVGEMAIHGGYAVSQQVADWDALEIKIRADLSRETQVYFLVETESTVAIGCSGAEVISLSGVLEEKKVLHISIVYVDHKYRNRGIGGLLLDELTNWGKEQFCDFTDLNVGVGNPARHLYEKYGFSEFRIQMTKQL